MPLPHHPESLAHPKGALLHPTQLYEAASWFVLFWILLAYQRRKDRRPGEIFFAFGVVYGIVRFLLEYLRGDPGHLGPLTTAQMTNLPLILICLILWIHRRMSKA